MFGVKAQAIPPRANEGQAMSVPPQHPRAEQRIAQVVRHGRGEPADQILEKQRVEKMNLSDGAEGGDVEITKMDVIDSNSNLVTEAYGDTPLEIRIHYTAFRNIGKANALVRIYRSDGLSVCLLRTHLDDFPVTLEKGDGIISVKLESNQLFGGMYYAIAWMMNADDSDGTANGASEWFEIKNRTAGREAQESVFEPRRQWNQVVLPNPENKTKGNQ
jgi:hypothetical protein